MGRPLIAWTICSAREAGLDRIIVSTDSDEIASVALEYGAEVPFKRPASLAEDVRELVEGGDHLARFAADVRTDHPERLGFPESRYLKFVLLRAVD